MRATETSVTNGYRQPWNPARELKDYSRAAEVRAEVHMFLHGRPWIADGRDEDIWHRYCK